MSHSSTAHTSNEKRISRSAIFTTYATATGKRFIPRGRAYVTLADDDSDEFAQVQSERFARKSQIVAINFDPVKSDAINATGIRCETGMFHLAFDTLRSQGVKPAVVNFDTQSMVSGKGFLEQVMVIMNNCPVDTLFCVNICLNNPFKNNVWSDTTFAERSSHSLAKDAQNAIMKALAKRRIKRNWSIPSYPHEYIQHGKRTKMATLFFYRESL